MAAVTYRSVKLLRGTQEISLNTAPYYFDDNAGWVDNGTSLEISLLVKSTAWADVDRAIAGLRRMITQGMYYAQAGSGDACYVYSKVCDNLSYTAEIGATWRRKKVLGGMMTTGRVMASPSGIAVQVTLTLAVGETWWRAAAEPVFEATTGLTTYAGGGMTVTAGVEPYVRRLGWASGTGFTARIFWVYASTGTAQLNLVRLSSDLRCFWSGSGNTFGIGNGTGTYYYSAAQAFTTGQVVEVVVRWTSASYAVYVNGVVAISGNTTIIWPGTPTRYRLCAPDAAANAQTFLSVQVWAKNLSDTEIATLATWGRPDPELALWITPTDGATPTPVENTSAAYKLYGAPGSVATRLRPIIAGYTANYDMLAVHLRTGDVPRHSTGGPVVKFECESGSLGANTASVADASASGGNVARFTPADTSYAVRTTITICADAVHMSPYVGKWRVMLQAKDNAASVQLNVIRWRYKMAGVAGDYSDEYSLPAVATRCLGNLGELTLPPTAWPEGATSSGGAEYSGSYLTIEIEAKNTAGTGTLDLDALYLAPADIEAQATATGWVVADAVLFLDFVSEPAAPSIVYDTWSNTEWGGTLLWEGTPMILETQPSTDPDDGALLWLYVYRDTSYQALPKDTLFAWLQVLPGWEI